ncbi:MAG: hypothetical protein HC819_04780 [Cyclobacteriaceae bacterium]|nr:hypothetical protein [Cyclobacteriaceae bacterium]
MKHAILFSVGVMFFLCSCEQELAEITSDDQFADDGKVANVHSEMAYITTDPDEYLHLLASNEVFQDFREHLGDQFTLKNFRIFPAAKTDNSIVHIPVILESSGFMSVVAIIGNKEVQDVYLLNTAQSSVTSGIQINLYDHEYKLTYSEQIEDDELMSEKKVAEIERIDHIIYHLF